MPHEVFSVPFWVLHYPTKTPLFLSHQNNTLEDCTFETIDTGAFYSSGQRATAFVNVGNVLRGNTFRRVYLYSQGGNHIVLQVQLWVFRDSGGGWDESSTVC